MQSKAATVRAYLDSLPADRRATLEAVRRAILANLDADYEEGMQYGMIGYCVPHRVFPDGYHCDPERPLMFAGLAAQKNYCALHLMSVYGNTKENEWLRAAFARAGRKLDMGKACIRFQRLDDLPLDVIGEAIRRTPARAFVDGYVRALAARGAAKRPAKRTAKARAAKVRGSRRAK